MKLTTEAYLDTGKSSLCKSNAGDLAEYLNSLVCRTFDGWTVDGDKPAHYIYGQGYDDECRPVGAVGLRGSDLPPVLRKFAESVADGALSRFDDGGSRAMLSLDVEISNEEFGGGVHIVVSEQVADNDDGALYRWTLDQLPARIWTELIDEKSKKGRK